MRITRPAHPEHRDRHGRGAQHGEPKPKLRGQLVPAVRPCLLHLPCREVADQKHQRCSEEEAGRDAQETEALDAGADVVDLAEDEVVAVEEGEEDDVDDGHVEGDEHDYGLGKSEQEGSVAGAAQARQEGVEPDFDLCSVAVVFCEGA